MQNPLIQPEHSSCSWGIVHSTGQGIRANTSFGSGQFFLQQEDPVIKQNLLTMPLKGYEELKQGPKINANTIILSWGVRPSININVFVVGRFALRKKDSESIQREEWKRYIILKSFWWMITFGKYTCYRPRPRVVCEKEQNLKAVHQERKNISSTTAMITGTTRYSGYPATLGGYVRQGILFCSCLLALIPLEKLHLLFLIRPLLHSPSLWISAHVFFIQFQIPEFSLAAILGTLPKSNEK